MYQFEFSERQQFLIDQGYAYKVSSLTKEINKQQDLLFYNKNDQKSLLEKLLQAKDVDDEIQNDPDDITPENVNRKIGDFSRINNNNSLQNSYQLQNRPRNKLFAQRYKFLKGK